MNVAFLGLGTMGAPMAANVRARGHALAVWNRSPGRAQPLVDAGARLAATPADAARG
ncbi:MAG TPA: NAD(P)-binding domain-containing protein, partial [Polyangia bacterium]